VPVDDVAVTASLGEGAPFAAQKCGKAARCIKLWRNLADVLPIGQREVMIVGLLAGKLQPGHIAGVAVMVGQRTGPTADIGLPGMQIAPKQLLRRARGVDAQRVAAGR